MISAVVKYKAGNGKAGAIEKIRFEKISRGSKAESVPSFMGEIRGWGKSKSRAKPWSLPGTPDTQQ